jgi:hypothetical protein
MKRFSIFKVLAVLTLAALVASCEKEEGPGGSSSIVGQVWVQNYNSDFTKINEEYSGAGEDVYLVYGNDSIYSERTKAGVNGYYQFEYLNEGNYTIYALSKDKDNPASSEPIAISVKIKISDKDQVVTAPVITIFN